MHIVFWSNRQIRLNIIDGHIRDKTEMQKNICILLEQI